MRKYLLATSIWLMVINVLNSCGIQDNSTTETMIPTPVVQNGTTEVRQTVGNPPVQTGIAEKPLGQTSTGIVTYDGSGDVLDTGMDVPQILGKINDYMDSLNARAGTGKIAVGNYSAIYHFSESGDTIDVDIDGTKTNIEGIRTKKEVNWMNRCDEMAKKLNCYGEENKIIQSKQYNACEKISLEGKECLIDYMGNGFVVASPPDNYNRILDLSPSGKYILIDTYIDGPNVTAPMGTTMIDAKTGAKVLQFMTRNDFGTAIFEGWTPDKSQFIYISKIRDTGTWVLNITKKDEFPKSDSIKLNAEVVNGWNDAKYAYLISESKNKDRTLEIFSISDLKKVYSKELGK